MAGGQLVHDLTESATLPIYRDDEPHLPTWSPFEYLPLLSDQMTFRQLCMAPTQRSGYGRSEDPLRSDGTDTGCAASRTLHPHPRGLDGDSCLPCRKNSRDGTRMTSTRRVSIDSTCCSQSCATTNRNRGSVTAILNEMIGCGVDRFHGVTTSMTETPLYMISSSQCSFLHCMSRP